MECHKKMIGLLQKIMASVSVEKATRKSIFTNIDLETDADVLIFLPSSEFSNLRILKMIILKNAF